MSQTKQMYGIDPHMIGRRALCDGGVASAGGPAGMLGAWERFVGRLTGYYFEEGDPPWRWYLMADLAEKPEEYTEDSVWCESGFLFLLDDAG